MVMSGGNTVLFEEKYKVNIEDFLTTSEIDEFVANKAGKKSLEVVFVGYDIVSNRGDVLPMIDTDIDARLDKSIKK